MKSIIIQPIITEKSLNDVRQNKYTFLVHPQASKSQISHAIKSLYQVDPVSINTTTKKPQNRRTGRRRLPTTTTQSKKAIIKLKPGQTISVFEKK